MTRRMATKLALGLIIPLALLLVWYVSAQRSAVVPSIAAVLDVLVHPFREPTNLDATSLAASAMVSIVRVACGFAAAALTAVPIGLLMGRSRFARDLLMPSVVAAMVLSPVAWMPLAILLFGLSSPATTLYGAEAWRHDLLDQLRFAVLIIIWVGAFVPIAVNAAAGARGVREAHVEAVRVLGATRAQVLRKVILPAAAPSIMTGLRLGGGIAWRVIIVAEIFPGTRGGLGYTIATAHEQAAYEYAFAAIAVVLVIGLCVDRTLRVLELRVGQWRAKER
jgi:sulfonate transport system permease protein